MHKDRAIWVSLGVLLVAFAAYQLRQDGGAGWMPGCFFRRFTGLECPGCGMTRASHAFLNGRFIEAFRFNPVGMVVFPLAVIGVGLEVLAWVRGKVSMFSLRSGRWGATVIAVVMIGWWVGRNLF